MISRDELVEHFTTHPISRTISRYRLECLTNEFMKFNGYWFFESHEHDTHDIKYHSQLVLSILNEAERMEYL